MRVTDEKLKPCPFCGGEAERLELTDEANFGGSVVVCKKCGASSPVHFDRKENLYDSWNQRAALEAALEEIRCLKAIIASCQWYWPEDDTSSEVCADSGREALVEMAYLDPGYVAAYARGGIVERRFFGWLPPADDADSDDEFEVDEATRAEAVAKMEAEKARRAALRGQS